MSGPAISCCQRSRTEIGKRILGSICAHHFPPTQEKNGRVQAGLTFSVFIGIQTLGFHMGNVNVRAGISIRNEWRIYDSNQHLKV